MKAGKDHVVPLSESVIKLIKAMPEIEGCHYVFASARSGKLSDMALSQLTRRMKVKAVPHAFMLGRSRPEKFGFSGKRMTIFKLRYQVVDATH
jgi:integrase